MGRLKSGWLLILALAVRTTPLQSAPSGMELCAVCHRKIYETYRRTAMARSLYRPRPENTVEDYRADNHYYHQASDTSFVMLERDGRYYQRRYQIGFDGKETNIDEQQVDYVMGSGNHVRTYLHRTSAGALLELPLAWYAEKGGYWAMSPGYDRADQPGSRRKISYECMFCHNAYPDIPAGHKELRSEPVYSGVMPEGIDCQRCHGPGDHHVAVAKTAGASAAAIRESIVNPARLSPTRQMEVCMQCHLETTSFPFPHSITKYDRDPFSYKVGEPLAGFMLFFDHGSAQEDRFQIVSSVYRLRMSQCFLKSGGELRCTTCHDPHRDAASAKYNDVCLGCHRRSLDQIVQSGRHTKSGDCVECHMPKRRTDDVVHAVMTDHYIQRRKPERDLLAEISEPSGEGIVYRGEVLPYYPAPLERTPGSQLYVALAQVRMDNNLEIGIAQLTAATRKYRPRQAEFYSELGDALRRNGKSENAIPQFEEALRLKPDSLASWVGLGSAFEAAGRYPKALEAFRHAIGVAPSDGLLWQELAQVYIKQGQTKLGMDALNQSLELDSTVPQTLQLLGTLWMESTGDRLRAEACFREAIRLQPDYAQAHMNLAVLLSESNRTKEAAYHFERAIHLRPDYALGHLNYGLMLRKLGRIGEAREQIGQAAASSDPNTRDAERRLLSELDAAN
jgi:predicted CXXCH cytochrome family protein